MRKDAQILLHRDECLHGVRLRLDHAAAELVIDAHGILIRRIVGIALQSTIAAVDNNATTKVGTRLHFNLGGMRQTLRGVGRDCEEQCEG